MVPVRWLRSSCNVGYAAALNTGIAGTSAEFLFLMNPDVFVLPGCTAALIRALEDGAAAAGPKFYWDHRKQFIMPPTEVRTRRSELLAALAEHGDIPARWARHQWRRHARRHWLTTKPMRTVALSGALLAVQRSAVEQAGPFDEGFRLYFEEQDWLARLVHKGLFSLYVPAAEAVHLFNQSAVQEPAAVEWFSQSNARFAKRYYGAWFLKLLAGCRRSAGPRLSPLPRIDGNPIRVSLEGLAGNPDLPLWVEISPLDRGFPAGATRVEDLAADFWSFPDDVWTYLAPGRYYITVCTAHGRELRRASFVRPSPKK